MAFTYREIHFVPGIEIGHNMYVNFYSRSVASRFLQKYLYSLIAILHVYLLGR